MVRRLLDRIGKPFDAAQGTRQLASGFTLIELLVVVAIIAILSFTVVTNLSSARAKARDARVAADLQEIGKAIDLYNANDELVAGTQASFVGTQGTIAAMNTGVISALKASTNKYLPSGFTLAHPNAANGTYAYVGTLPAGTSVLSYVLCGSVETPTAAFYIVENGSGYRSPTTKC